MSLIKSVHPVPDVTGVVKNICTLTDYENWDISHGPYEVDEDGWLDIRHLANILRVLLEVEFLYHGSNFVSTHNVLYFIAAQTHPFHYRGKGRRWETSLRNQKAAVDFLP
jgi:hypothetical protein